MGEKLQESFFLSMVGNDPVITTGDIYSVNSSPAKYSGLCWLSGLITFEAISPHPPNSANPVHPLCAVCVFAKVGGEECGSFLAQSSALPPFPPLQPGSARSVQ